MRDKGDALLALAALEGDVQAIAGHAECDEGVDLALREGSAFGSKDDLLLDSLPLRGVGLVGGKRGKL